MEPERETFKFRFWQRSRWGHISRNLCYVYFLSKFSGKSFLGKSGIGVLLFVLLLVADSIFHIPQKSVTLRLEGRLRQFVGTCEPAGHHFLSLFNNPVVHVKPKIVFMKKQIEFQYEHFHQFLESQNVIN